MERGNMISSPLTKMSGNCFIFMNKLILNKLCWRLINPNYRMEEIKCMIKH